jgi:hypothetical protein
MVARNSLRRRSALDIETADWRRRSGLGASWPRGLLVTPQSAAPRAALRSFASTSGSGLLNGIARSGSSGVWTALAEGLDRKLALGKEDTMDEDLTNLDREALIAEVKRLRAGIREHRDSTEHELCWHHPQLWRLLPERTDPQPAVPDWPQFLRGCVRYRESLDRQLPRAARTNQEFESDR